MPDIPPLRDFVPGYEPDQWWGIGLRKNTPAEIIERLNIEMNAVLSDSQVQARVAELGGTVFAGSPAELGSFVAEDTQKWAKVVKLSGAKPE